MGNLPDRPPTVEEMFAIAALIAREKGKVWAFAVEHDEEGPSERDVPTVGDGLGVTDVLELRLIAQDTETVDGAGLILSLFDQEGNPVFGFLVRTEDLTALLWSQTPKGRQGGQQG
jgi:hypothetical protein